MLSVGYRIPEKHILVSSGPAKSKVELLEPCRLLARKGYVLYATGGTYHFLHENGVPVTQVGWPDEEGSLKKATEMIREKAFDLVINIPKNLTKRELTNGYQIRRGAIDFNIPLLTNARLAAAFIYAFCKVGMDDIQIKAWSDYH
jgi:carbamoyl-phosphate synthase large subunit